MGDILMLPLPARTGDDVQTGDEVVSRDWKYHGIVRAIRRAGSEIELQRDDGLGAVCLAVTSVRLIPPKITGIGVA